MVTRVCKVKCFIVCNKLGLIYYIIDLGLICNND